MQPNLSQKFCHDLLINITASYEVTRSGVDEVVFPDGSVQVNKQLGNCENMQR